jgi:hypothetical protein
MFRNFKKICILFLFLAPPAFAEAPKSDLVESIRPILAKHCWSCHDDKKKSAGIDLWLIFIGMNDTKSLIVRDGKKWMNAVKQVQSGEMPPRSEPPMSLEEQETLVKGINEILYSSLQQFNPGRVVIRRLSHTEYQNSVLQLVGVSYNAQALFPSDGSGGLGFDNFASTLFVTPLKMERYYAAADEIMEQAHASPALWRLLVPETYVEPFWRRAYTWFLSLFTSNRSTRASDGAVKAAEDVILPFAGTAFRRFLKQEEKEKLLTLFRTVYEGTDTPDRYDQALKETFKAVLISPNFLYRYEEEQPVDNPFQLSNFELASRLSFFLWSSVPDKELYEVAYREDLHDPVVLKQQVKRMLQDPRARLFSESFATQWFGISRLRETNPVDPERFPEMTPSLRQAMYGELVEYFDHVLTKSKNFLDLLDSDYTFLNEELAAHYSIEGVKGDELRKVTLQDRIRGGVLGMGGVLTTTSLPLRTSPVLRGKWVLEELLGTPAPPPPPDAGELPEEAAADPNASIRDLLVLHRSKPACIGCHQKMDPIGFGLENFDAVGRWRTKYGDAAPIVAWDTLSSGEVFSGPAELKKILKTKSDLFARVLSEKMFVYALGRDVSFVDEPYIQRLIKNLQENNFNTEKFILELVNLEPFRYKENDKSTRFTRFKLASK